MLQCCRASPSQCGQGQGTQCGPWAGNSRLLGQGTWFGPQMGTLMGQGTQGDCSRAPTEIYRLGPMAQVFWGTQYRPQTGIQWTGGYSATGTSLSIAHPPPRSNLQRQLITKIKLFSRWILNLHHDPWFSDGETGAPRWEGEGTKGAEPRGDTRAVSPVPPPSQPSTGRGGTFGRGRRFLLVLSPLLTSLPGQTAGYHPPSLPTGWTPN